MAKRGMCVKGVCIAKGTYIVKGGMQDKFEACLAGRPCMAGGMHGKGRHAFKRDGH